MKISSRLFIDDNELHEQFVRASGPGGQNVNKVATAVQLRVDIHACRGIPPDVRARLLKLAGKRINAQGELVIIAQRHRTQVQNRADARARLAALMLSAATPPKARKATAPSRSSVEKRIQSKRVRSSLKRDRQRVMSTD